MCVVANEPFIYEVSLRLCIVFNPTRQVLIVSPRVQVNCASSGGRGGGVTQLNEFMNAAFKSINIC